MPLYPYFCRNCGANLDVAKRLDAIDNPESCPSCGVEMQRTIASVNLMGANDWTESFNPAFGCVVKSKRHQREILAKFKAEGKEMIEVGNEPLENIHKHFDSKREEARKIRWSEPTEKILQEALS